MNTALDSKSQYLGFDSHCWSCVEVSWSGKLLVPHCLCLSSSDGFLQLEDENCYWVAQAVCILAWRVCCILPENMRLLECVLLSQALGRGWATDGRVVREDVSVTWNVLSWSGHHEFETHSSRLGVHGFSVSVALEQKRDLNFEPLPLTVLTTFHSPTFSHYILIWSYSIHSLEICGSWEWDMLSENSSYLLCIT